MVYCGPEDVFEAGVVGGAAETGGSEAGVGGCEVGGTASERGASGTVVIALSGFSR